jgi:Peptidase family M28
MADQSQPRRRTAGPIALIGFVVLGFLIVKADGPPAAAPESAPAADFSAARAMRDLRVIAQRPHPVASADNARVRDYLMRRLIELGTNPSVQTATAARAWRSGPRTFAVVHNLIAKVPGSASTGTVMLAAHYDSVPSGPGAGDDGAAVAALLETLRALKTGPPLRNDLLVVFTDGEEAGLLGAQAFVGDYPALQDIKVVLNFEMRGDYGPSIMFQTSGDDAWLIRQFGAAAPYPRASSLSPEVYKRMPNDTDLTVFMAAGLAGMNFAATGGLQRYHTRLDDITHLDLRTLQHHGSYALALSRGFGTIDLRHAHSAHDEIYFNLVSWLVRYATYLGLPLAIVTMLLLIGVLTAGMRQGRITAPGIIAGFFAFVIALAIAVGASQLLYLLVRDLAGNEILPSHTTYGAGYFALASIALVFAALWAMYDLLVRVAERANLAAGALLVWGVAMLACASAVAGGSYLLTWPLICATMALLLKWSGDGERGMSIPIAAATLALAPAIVLFAPVLDLSRDGTPMFLAAGAICAALLFGLAIPYLDLLASNSRWIAPAALGVAGIVLFACGKSASRFSPAQPRPDTIFYLLNANTGAASWESLDRAPDSWTAQFFRHHVRLGSLAAATGMTEDTPDEPRDAYYNRNQLFSRVGGGLTIESDAAGVALAPPELSVVDDSTSGDIRTVRMHIVSVRRAPIIWIAIPADVVVVGSSADGKSPGGPESEGYTAWFWGVPDAGFDLTLQVTRSGPISVTVIDQTDGLPAAASAGIRPRPASVMPSPFVFFDWATLVRKTFVVGDARTPSQARASYRMPPGPAHHGWRVQISGNVRPGKLALLLQHERDALVLVPEGGPAEECPSAVHAILLCLGLQRTQLRVIDRKLIDFLIRKPSVRITTHCGDWQRVSVGA